jgi:SHS2 domain-containing protein
VYEAFEHTADVGLRARAADVPTLLAEAAKGLFAIIAGDLGQIAEREAFEVRVDGEDRAHLLFDWLSELLYAFEARRILVRRCAVRAARRGVDATCFGERFDPTRHRLQHEVKAITYHQLAVVETDGGLEATVIVDI